MEEKYVIVQFRGPTYYKKLILYFDYFIHYIMKLSLHGKHSFHIVVIITIHFGK